MKEGISKLYADEQQKEKQRDTMNTYYSDEKRRSREIK